MREAHFPQNTLKQANAAGVSKRSRWKQTDSLKKGGNDEPETETQKM
jgi:hypothetical protein